MEIDFLLPLADKGIPGVLQVTGLEMSESGRCEGFLPELINHVRATGCIQLLVSCEAHQDPPQTVVLQRRLDAFALEGEVFTVSRPVLVERATYRIDVHRGAEELIEARSDQVDVDPSDEVLLQRTIDLFPVGSGAAAARTRNAILNAGAFYLWQMAELPGVGSHKGLGRVAWSLVTGKLREHGCQERMVFSEERRRYLEARSPRYPYTA